MNDIKVIVRCMGCGKIRKIGPYEMPKGQHPMCDDCFMPMIPVKAELKHA